MYPTKGTLDYMSEMNRLFPKTDTDILHSPPVQMPRFQSPFNTTVNRSSSSADSTSPESFPDISTRLDFTQPEHTYETPFVLRRQRPIVGRKIFDAPAPVLEPAKPELDITMWQTEDHSLFLKTPPHRIPENYMQKVYELFPNETKGYEFRTPVQSPHSLTVSSPTFSPRPVMRSPSMPRYPAAMSPRPAGPSSYSDMNKMCMFCRKNGETPEVYMTHAVKGKIGNRNIVTCPILRSHVCSTCGATGDNAHTITYCPVMRNSNNGLPLQSTTITLKNTRIKSNGRRRY